MPVINFGELRHKCEIQGFDESEMRFIISLAARLQNAARKAMAADDTTLLTDHARVLRIHDRHLTEAVRRFQNARALLANRRVETGRSIDVPLARPRGRKAEWGAALLLTLLTALACYIYVVKWAPAPRQPASVETGP